MELHIMKDIILNMILITFPILIYFVLVSYNEEIKIKKDTLLTITLITSLYLCLKYVQDEVNTKILLFCNIPIVIAYMKNKPVLGVLLSVANILYSHFILEIDILITIIKYISYLVLYLCAKKKKLSNSSFILSVAVIQAFFLSFEYFFKDIKVSLENLLMLLMIIFIYYFQRYGI